MRFWDASAIVPLLVNEPKSDVTNALLREDRQVILWWGSRLETCSALARGIREQLLVSDSLRILRSKLDTFINSAFVVEPSEALLERAERLIFTHPLRAADSLQLAAALSATLDRPRGMNFVCYDSRLREAAQREGFQVLPEEDIV